VEYRIIRKDGEIRWIEDYGHYIEYDDQNSLYYVFISDITEKHEQAESDKALHSAVIEALTKAYDSVWLINDIETQKFELFRIDKEMEHLMPANIAAKLEKFTQALAFYSKLVFEEDRQYFLEATSSENIVRNTESKLIYAVPFRRVFEKDIRHYKVEFTRLNLPGGKTGIVAGFKNVDDEVQREQTIQHSINQRDAIIEALTRTYDSAFLITDIKEERFELYRVDENTVHFIPSQEAAKIKKFSNAFLNYSKLVMKEDRDQFLSAVTPENIIENTSNKLIYSVPFRRVFENGVRYYNVEFSKIDLGNGDVNYIAGFKDVDEVRNGKPLD
jgi:PAS domain-containing protein